MGTSISHGSPSTSNWRAATAAYVSPSIPIRRAVREVWRAATHQPLGDLASDLSAPIISQCLRIAVQASSPQEASREASMAIALSGQASLAADLAHRAALQSSRSAQDREAVFTSSLFCAAADYLVSRDIPGYIGIGKRLKNVTDSIAFKQEVRQQVREIVSTVPRPKGLDRDPSRWKDYVATVVSSLVGRE